MRKFIIPAVALTGALATASAFAQGTQQPQGGTMQQVPMQQMPMMQGQGSMMMGGCPMMQRMAAMDTRLRQLEERSGIPAPATPPGR
jgi:hypothetical protein